MFPVSEFTGKSGARDNQNLIKLNLHVSENLQWTSLVGLVPLEVKKAFNAEEHQKLIHKIQSVGLCISVTNG